MSKKISFIFFIALAAIGGFYLYNKYRVAPAVDIAKLSLITIDGQPFDFKSLKGKKTVISFSASWCGNCIRELNALKKIKDTELGDVEIVVIDDEDLETMINFKDKREYPFTFLKLNEKVFGNIGINAIPVNYFYNAEQKLVGNEVGEIDWLDPSTREHYKQIMN